MTMARMQKLKTFLAMFFTVLLLLNTNNIASSEDSNSDEKNLRVGYLIHDTYLIDGERLPKPGYEYDYLERVASYNGWKYEFVFGELTDLLEGLEDGSIDIICNLSKTEDRAKKFDYGEYPQSEHSYLLVIPKTGSKIDKNNLYSLEGKTIGVVKGSTQGRILKNWLNTYEYTDVSIVEFSSVSKLLNALENRNIDAVVFRNGVHLKNMQRIANIGNSKFYFATNKHKPWLKQGLDYAQKEILDNSPNFKYENKDRYSDLEKEIKELTVEEEIYNYAKKEIKVGYLNDAKPYCYTTTMGDIRGLYPDVLNRMASTYGLTCKYHGYDDYRDILEDLNEGKLDVVVPLLDNAWMANNHHLKVASNISNAEILRVTRANSTAEPKKIAISATSALQQYYVQSYYPDEEYVWTNSIEDCIFAVRNGDADCTYFADDLFSEYIEEAYVSRALSVKNMHTPIGITVGVNKNEKILLSIINKNIANIYNYELLQSVLKTAKYEAEENGIKKYIKRNFRFVVVLVCFIGFFSVLLFVMWRKYMREQKKVLKATREANEAKTKFLSSMSHDIRTPMNAIIGVTEIAMHQTEEPEKVKENLRKIHLSSTHLLTLINDILDISKIESGKMAMHFAPHSIAVGVETMANMVRSSIVKKNQKFIVYASNIISDQIVVDDLRLNQLTINLLSNAVKYTQEGGTIEFHLCQEEVPDNPELVSLSVMVKDNGMGMSKEFQKIMYESFSRVEDSRINKNVGSGLGLAICKQIVSLLGGSITCESALGEGTTFTVNFVVSRGEASTFEPLSIKKVLIVDDDPITQKDAKECFERIGVACHFLTSETLQTASLDGYDVAFVDTCWPDESMGIQNAEHIRCQLGSNFPIVMTSTLTLPDGIKDLGKVYGYQRPYFSETLHPFLTSILSAETKQIGDESTSNELEGMKVLVAEDNDLNWEIIEALLEMEGICPVRVANGKECIETMNCSKEGDFEIVLMDIRMPVMDGLEATKTLRKSEKLWIQNIPIVAMTADAFAEDVRQCLDAGMNSHLSKPIDIKKVLTILKKIRKESVEKSGGVNHSDPNALLKIADVHKAM